MISYADLFKVLKAGGTVSALPYTPTWHKLCILGEHGIVALTPDSRKFTLHPKQAERMAAKAAQNAVNQATTDAPRMVHVDWSGRGHSSGKYKVLSETERYVTIEFHLERKMTVSKARVKDAA